MKSACANNIQLTKMCDPRFTGTYCCISLWSSDSEFANSVFMAILQNLPTAKNVNLLYTYVFMYIICMQVLMKKSVIIQ